MNENELTYFILFILVVLFFTIIFFQFQLSYLQSRILTIVKYGNDELYKEKLNYLKKLEIKETQKIVEKGIDRSSFVMEKAHQTFADLTFDLLSLFPETKEASKNWKESHDIAAKTLFETIRTINTQFGAFTDELLKIKKKDKE